MDSPSDLKNSYEYWEITKDLIDQSKFISHKCKIQDHKKAFELAKDGNLASKVMIDLCN